MVVLKKDVHRVGTVPVPHVPQSDVQLQRELMIPAASAPVPQPLAYLSVPLGPVNPPAVWVQSVQSFICDIPDFMQHPKPLPSGRLTPG